MEVLSWLGNFRSVHLQVGVPVAMLLDRDEFGFRLQPDGFVTICRTALFEPEFSGATGDGLVGDHGLDGRIFGQC